MDLRSSHRHACGRCFTHLKGISYRYTTGAWEVFYAPHIRTLGTLLLSRVEPVRYQYQASARGGAGELVSHVRLVNALGTFHLSSAARLFEKDVGALGIEFTNFCAFCAFKCMEVIN